MQIIPAIDLKGGRCVRLIQGDMERETVFSDNPVEQAKKWEEGGAELIHIVDLDGAFEGLPKNGELVKDICKAVKTPIQLGGGIRNISTAAAYFDAGVSRIVIGSLLLKDSDSARAIAEKYRHKVVAGIDVKENMATGDGWVTSSTLTGKELMGKLKSWPLAAVVFTDISRDGMMQGVNIDAIKEMALASPFPLIASGGVSSSDDLLALSKIEGVSGAIIGKALYTKAIDLAAAVKEFQC